MSKLINLTGMTFGGLTVLSFAGVNADNKALWSCQCSCGNLVVKRGKKLRFGKELYCGDQHPTKVCTECKAEKNKSEYHKNGHKIQSVCKMCKSRWYEENKDIIKHGYIQSMKDPKKKKRRQELNKISRIKNKEQQRAWKLQYDKSYAVKERKKKSHHQRKTTDMQYIIKRRLRWRIRDTVKRIFGRKYKYESSLVLLGCDMEYFKNYLESKFVEGMGWHNISEWHIDHIKPCSKFDLTKLEEQKECFHYSNLQPLWWIDNLKKGSSYPNKNSITPSFNSDGALCFLNNNLAAANKLCPRAIVKSLA